MPTVSPLPSDKLSKSEVDFQRLLNLDYLFPSQFSYKSKEATFIKGTNLVGFNLGVLGEIPDTFG